MTQPRLIAMKQEEGSAKYYLHQWSETQQPTYQLYQASTGYLGPESFAQDSYYSMPWNYDSAMSYPYSLWQQAYQMPSYSSHQALTPVNPCQSTAATEKEVPEPVQKKKQFVVRRQRKPSKRSKKHLSNYYWSTQENRRYCEYLRMNPGVFELTVTEKKNMRVNVMMSRKVKTRTPQQCHSHHQKMMKKFGSIESIIDAMQNGCLDAPRKHNKPIVSEPVIERSQVKAEDKLPQC